MSEINIGDKVLLQLGADFTSAPKGLKRWDGCTFFVSKRKKILDRYLYYELHTCRSERGVNYAILEDWINLTR